MIIAQLPTDVPGAAEIMKALLNEQILQWGAVYVLVLQTFKFYAPFIDTTKPLSKEWGTAFFAGNFLMGATLSAVFTPGEWWMKALVAPVAGAYMWFLFEWTKKVFVPPTTTP